MKCRDLLTKMIPLRIKKLIRPFYYQTGYYQNLQVEQYKRSASNDINLLKIIFDDNLTVRLGLFKGMKYITSATGSLLLPKIAGSFEEPIQPWINDAIECAYKNIVNLGSAEGYYAVGLAYRLKLTCVYAFDINPHAQKLNIELAKLNQVPDRVIVDGLCTHHRLNELIADKTLIVCDIEGAEKELLNPAKTQNLTRADIIVEVHDFIEEGLSDLLISRFHKTHKIAMIVDYPRSTEKYAFLTDNQTLLNQILDEGRPPAMRWLRMLSLCQSTNNRKHNLR